VRNTSTSSYLVHSELALLLLGELLRLGLAHQQLIPRCTIKTCHSHHTTINESQLLLGSDYPSRALKCHALKKTPQVFSRCSQNLLTMHLICHQLRIQQQLFGLPATGFTFVL